MLQLLHPRLGDGALLAGGLDELTLPQDVHPFDLPRFEAVFEEAEDGLVGLNLLLDELHLAARLRQPVPRARHLG